MLMSPATKKTRANETGLISYVSSILELVKLEIKESKGTQEDFMLE